MAGILVVVVGSFIAQKILFPSDERRVERTIELFATSENPAHCDERATVAYLEQITGAERPFADEVCELESPGPATDSVDVREISIEGGRARALVAYSGGFFDGTESVLSLVEEDGDWKIDRALSFTHFDRAAFRRAFRESYREFGSPEARVRCALSRESGLSDAEIQQSVLEEGRAVFARIAVACDRAGVEREVRASLARGGLDQGGTECVERGLAALGDARLARLQVDLPAYGRLVTACDRDAIVRYIREESIAAEDDPETTACLVGELRDLSPIRQFFLTYDDERYEALFERCEG